MENSKVRPALKEAVEALLAQIEQMIAEGLGVGVGFGADGEQRIPAGAGGQGEQAWAT